MTQVGELADLPGALLEYTANDPPNMKLIKEHIVNTIVGEKGWPIKDVKEWADANIV